MDILPLRRELGKALSNMPEKLSRVLVLRYGLEGSKQRSHSEIAKEMDLSTKQVVTLETRGIRRLRHPKVSKPLVQLIEHFSGDIWTTVSDIINDSVRIVYRKDHQQRFLSLPTEILLLIELGFGGVEAWLSMHACETDSGWFLSEYPDEKVLKTLSKLKETDLETFFPAPIKLFLDTFQVDFHLMELLLALHPGTFGKYRGYMARSPLSTHNMRSIRIHMMLLHKYTDEVVPFDQIIQAYHEIYNDDELTLETMKPALNSKPHMFTIFGDSGCSANGTAGEPSLFDDFDEGVESEHSDGDRVRYIFDRPWSEVSANDLIREIVEARGICRKSDIVKHFLDRTGGRYAVTGTNSVYIIEVNLRLNPDLVELAPSVFGLRDKYEELDPVTATTDLLLTRADCRKFVVARYAGEPLNFYPLWTSAMEYKWCTWLERSMHQPASVRSDRYYWESGLYRHLFESILSICDPDNWAISGEKKRVWHFRKEALGFYHFQNAYHDDVWETIPSFQDLFAVAKLLKQNGYINYIHANHALAHTQEGSTKAVPVLALLVVLEMALPGENWQKKHEVGPRINEQMSLMIKEVQKKGFLHWDDETGILFREQLGAGTPEAALGWVDANSIDTLLNSLNGSKSPTRDRRQNEMKKKDLPLERPTDEVKHPAARQLEFPL